MLMLEGFTEQYCREQSLDWLEWAAFHIDRRYSLRLANEAVVLAQGNAASQSEEANEAFSELLMQLRGPDDEEVAYLLDPNAKADTDALRKAGVHLRPPEQRTPPPPPTPPQASQPDPLNPGYTIPPFEEDQTDGTTPRPAP